MQNFKSSFVILGFLIDMDTLNFMSNCHNIFYSLAGVEHN